nr:methylmalonyl Co-A mutase-associated GTPase MeaB [Rhabdothermincola salaria]
MLDAARGGDRGALARLLSTVERGGDGAREVSRAVHPVGGAATTVGITGSPGAGKSTLVSALVGEARRAGERMAVLAIDPSSPFTGGAILGDRVRMGEHALDDGVFIRSMATRGHLGGLSLTAPAAVRVLDAAGWPWVVLETVGVGQVEVEVAGEADTTVVVVNPGWGDAVQANKAGLMEIADVFVINKADRPGAADTRRDLESMLALADRGGSDGGRGPAGSSGSASGPGPWVPPIVETVATTGQGVAELWGTLARHREWGQASGEVERRRARRSGAELHRIVVARLMEEAAALGSGAFFDGLRDEVVARRLDPWSAADRLLAEL